MNFVMLDGWKMEGKDFERSDHAPDLRCSHGTFWEDLWKTTKKNKQ
jgi:hypothetical protein